MTLPSYVASSWVLGPQGSTASHVVTKPAAWVSGDIALVCLYYAAALKTITPPTDWHEITHESSQTSKHTEHVYWKLLTGSEPATYTWSWTGAAWAETQGIAIHDADPTTPSNTSQVNHSPGNTQLYDCPAVTPTVANTLLVVFGASAQWQTWSSGSGMTQASDTNYGREQVTAYITGPAAGVSSGVLQVDATSVGDEMVGITLAIQEVQSSVVTSTRTATPVSVALTAGQTALPTATVANPGSWTDQDSGTTDLHTPLQAIDANYDQSPAGPVGAGFTVSLANLSPPESGTRTLRLRLQKTAATGQMDLTVNLRDSAGTLIQAFSGGALNNIPATSTTVDLTVTNAIVDYAGLRVELLANQSAA